MAVTLSARSVQGLQGIAQAALERLAIGAVCAALAVSVANAQPDRDLADATTAIRSALAGGAYEDADRRASTWPALTERLHGPSSIEFGDALELLATARLRNGRAAEADSLVIARRAVEVKERLLGVDAPSVASALDTLGSIHTDRGEMQQALPLLERALAIRRRGANINDAADSADHLAFTLTLMQRFGDAARVLEDARRMRDGSQSTSELAMTRTLFATATLHRYDGAYGKASTLLASVLDTRERLLPHDHADIRLAIQLRGELHFLEGDITGARADWQRALEMGEHTLRPNHPDLAVVLRFLALAARALGDLTTARQLVERALPIAEQSLSACHQERAGLLGDYAEIEKDLGNYQQARTMNASARAAFEHCLDINDQRIATVVHNQALVADAMGDLALAERLQRDAVARWTRGLGPNHPYVARGLDALAEVVAARGRLTSARQLYEQALGLRRRALGNDHPDVAWTLTNIAEVLDRSGSIGDAMLSVARAIQIYQRIGAGDEPDHLARALALRGSIELEQGKPEAARSSFSEAGTLRRNIFGDSHPLTADTQVSLAAADFALNRRDGALTEALDAERVGRDHLRFTIRYLPERQSLEYAAKRPRGLDLAVSILIADDGRSRASAVADAVIASRGVILDELAARARVVAGAKPELSSLNTAVTATRGRFARLMLRSLQDPASTPRAMLDDALQQKEDAERVLAESSLVVRAEEAHARVGLDEVRRALPQDSALVSFVRYNRTSFGGSRGTGSTARPSYVAFVLTGADADVVAVPLGSAASVDAVIAAWRLQASGSTLTDDASSAEGAYRSAGTQLRRTIWDPLTPHINGASLVFIVPDGAINLVSFAALPTGGSRYLVETGPAIHLLSTERDLVPLEDPRPGRGLLAVGGPTYDLRAAVVGPLSVRRSGCAGIGPLHFEDLPGARAEAQDIARIWSSSAPGLDARAQPDDLIVLSGRAAGKAAVMKAFAGRRVVHLATHGFFLGGPCGPGVPLTRGVGGLTSVSSRVPFPEDNPLLSSGLAFAGANTSYGARGVQENGILTAEEVASLNLQGTEWAVLSACDTGLGEIRAGEGVFGLRRAFQIAGVRTIIMSLWSVEDQSARAWMRSLYDGRWRKGLSTADAVQQASLRLLQERRAHGQSTHPFYWAAFVAAGDWR